MADYPDLITDIQVFAGLSLLLIHANCKREKSSIIDPAMLVDQIDSLTEITAEASEEGIDKTVFVGIYTDSTLLFYAYLLGLVTVEATPDGTVQTISKTELFDKLFRWKIQLEPYSESSSS